MARVTLEELKARQPTVDHERLRRTTEEEIRRHAAEDGEDIDAPRAYEDMVPPALIRRRLGLTQAEIVALAKNSFLASFLPEADKQRHLAAIDAFVASMP